MRLDVTAVLAAAPEATVTLSLVADPAPEPTARARIDSEVLPKSPLVVALDAPHCLWVSVSPQALTVEIAEAVAPGQPVAAL